MASKPPARAEAPSNFYLRNPLALLVAKENLKDSEDGDLLQTQLKSANGSVGTRNGNGKVGTEVDRPVDAFIGEGTAAKQHILELSHILDASQLNRDDTKGDQGRNRTTSGSAPSSVPRKHTPYQIMFSSTFQCYTSIAFYGALLTQLRSWIKQLDSSSARHRAIVWSHLFCMVDTDQTSSDPLSPALQAILSQPKMALIDVELLWLAVLLSTKLVPHLLTSPSPSSSATVPTGSPPKSPSHEEILSNVKHSSQATSTPILTSAESAASFSELASENLKGIATTVNSSDDPFEMQRSPPSVAEAVSPENSSASSLASSTSDHIEHFSIEDVKANAVGFYQYYRSRVKAIHEELVNQVSSDRRQAIASMPSHLLSTTSPSIHPSQSDLVSALALRQLATLTVWIPKLESIPGEPNRFLAAAVQTVPVLRDAFSHHSSSPMNTSLSSSTSSSAASGTPTQQSPTTNLPSLLAKWTASPRKHITAISALYNAISMLRDFGAYDPKDFMIIKFDNMPTSSGMGLNDSSTTSSMQIPFANFPSAVGITSNALSGPFSWGTSPLPAWSPVPSPLTTFPGPFGSLSPVTFVARSSPLTLGSPGLVNPLATHSSHMPTFSGGGGGGGAAPSGAVHPTHSRPSAGSDRASMNFASPSAASSGVSLLGGRSAFGALKRAAEEEAENDLPIKRPKLAEI
jgi:hypothetical protein